MLNYSTLLQISTFEERLDYLLLRGSVGQDTFGFDRYLNQIFYKTKEWRDLRDYVIIRDNGCDLALEGYTIFDKILVHHMNPIKQSDILDRSDILLDPEFLICVSHDTHNQIHYGKKVVVPKFVERTKGDTTLWNTLQ